VGGPGSGRWRGHDKRTTVEDCLVLPIGELLRHRALAPGARSSGIWVWTHTGENEPLASIGFEADAVAPADAWIRLYYTANDNPVDYRVRLSTTWLNFGGLRWWFLCPLARANGGPARRVAKLYLPPGQIYFGSREGHGLTYTSCQESHDRLFRRIAAELGTNEGTVRRVFKEIQRAFLVKPRHSRPKP
jgi:hypothetical protein